MNEGRGLKVRMPSVPPPRPEDGLGRSLPWLLPRHTLQQGSWPPAVVPQSSIPSTRSSLLAGGGHSLHQASCSDTMLQQEGGRAQGRCVGSPTVCSGGATTWARLLPHPARNQRSAYSPSPSAAHARMSFMPMSTSAWMGSRRHGSSSWLRGEDEEEQVTARE